MSSCLLLRADIHTLFDRGHMAIDPTDGYYVYFSPEFREHYHDWEGYMINGRVWPDFEALMERWETFKKRWDFLNW